MNEKFISVRSWDKPTVARLIDTAGGDLEELRRLYRARFLCDPVLLTEIEVAKMTSVEEILPIEKPS